MTLTIEISEDSVARVQDMAKRSHRTFDEVIENLLQKFANEVVCERPEDSPDYDPDDPPVDNYEVRMAAVRARTPEQKAETFRKLLAASTSRPTRSTEKVDSAVFGVAQPAPVDPASVHAQ